MSVSRVAVVHDYLTQRGGAERVVLSMLEAFPGAPVYTSLYDAGGTFPEFAEHDVRSLPINQISLLRRKHRLALPVLAPAFSRLEVDADVVFCSSSGWAHGVRTRGAKIVYCYTPARWLYQWTQYAPGTAVPGRLALRLLRPWLLRWDARSAASANRYLTSSTEVRDRIRRHYGIEAEILPPPFRLSPEGPTAELADLPERFLLCVARLLPYKNVDAVIRAVRGSTGSPLVIVGSGPDDARLRRIAGDGVRLVGSVDDATLRGLYARATAVVSAAYEDYGLTPIEAAAFGKPSIVLRWGGFRDTVIDGETGIFFDRPDPRQIREAITRALTREWSPEALRRHAERFSNARFVARLRSVVAEVRDENRRALPALTVSRPGELLQSG